MWKTLTRLCCLGSALWVAPWAAPWAACALAQEAAAGSEDAGVDDAEATSAAAAAAATPPPSGADAVGFGDSSAATPSAANAARADASDSAGFGDAAGFGDSPGASSAPGPLPPAEPSPWLLSGSLRMDGALRAGSDDEPNRLGKLRQTFDARLSYAHELLLNDTRIDLRLLLSGRSEADFAYLMNAEAYDRPTRELYGSQLLVRETFVAMQLSAFELAIGRQIVNFGQAEMLSALDVVNPRDLREPLLADVADLRMPVFMTRASFTHERLRVEALVVHEPYFGLLPAPLGEFSPMRKLLLSNPALSTAFAGRTLHSSLWPEHALWSVDASQFHARATWSGSGFDLALHVGSLLDGLGVPGLPSAQAFAQQDIGFPIYHPRYAMLGHSGAYTTGAFVLRWEVALDLDRSLALLERNAALLSLSARRFTQGHAVLGLSYIPNTATSAALELSQSYVFDNPARVPQTTQAPLWPVEAPQLALRFSHHFLSDRASLALLVLWIGGTEPNAWVARGELGYALTDTLHASLGAITYQPSARFGPFYGFAHHERVFAGLRWDFSS